MSKDLIDAIAEAMAGLSINNMDGESADAWRSNAREAIEVMRRETVECEQDDHDRVWQMGREAGFRDALIALAERGGKMLDALDRDITDALRRDAEYREAHDEDVRNAVLLPIENYASRCGVLRVEPSTKGLADALTKAREQGS